MKFFKKSDMIIILGIIVVAAVLWFSYNKIQGSKVAMAEIYDGSELIETIPLDTKEEKSFTVPQKEQVVFHLGSDGTISFESSDCPDQVCVHAGKLSKVGESAACLPNQLILKIVPTDGHNEDTTDIIIG